MGHAYQGSGGVKEVDEKEGKNDEKPVFSYLRSQLHSKYITKCCNEAVPERCQMECKEIDHIDYTSDYSCKKFLQIDSEFMTCLKKRIYQFYYINQFI